MRPESLFDASSETWEEEVLKSEILVAVVFWSPGCPHCRAFLLLFEELSRGYSGKIKFVKLNTDENMDVAVNYGIMDVPTLKFFCGGRPVYERVGSTSSEELKKILDDVLASHKNCVARSSPIYYV